MTTILETIIFVIKFSILSFGLAPQMPSVQLQFCVLYPFLRLLRYGKYSTGSVSVSEMEISTSSKMVIGDDFAKLFKICWSSLNDRGRCCYQYIEVLRCVACVSDV